MLTGHYIHTNINYFRSYMYLLAVGISVCLGQCTKSMIGQYASYILKTTISPLIPLLPLDHQTLAVHRFVLRIAHYLLVVVPELALSSSESFFFMKHTIVHILILPAAEIHPFEPQ